MKLHRILALALLFAGLAGATDSAGDVGPATGVFGQVRRVTILYTGFGRGNVDAVAYCT